MSFALYPHVFWIGFGALLLALLAYFVIRERRRWDRKLHLLRRGQRTTGELGTVTLRSYAEDGQRVTVEVSFAAVPGAARRSVRLDYVLAPVGAVEQLRSGTPVPVLFDADDPGVAMIVWAQAGLGLHETNDNF